MYTAKIFKNRRSQAVQLPKECEFAVDEVYICKIGEGVLLFPAGKAWDVLSDSIKHFSEDYMREIEQPSLHQ